MDFLEDCEVLSCFAFCRAYIFNFHILSTTKLFSQNDNVFVCLKNAHLRIQKKQLNIVQINVSEDVVSLKNDIQICVCVEDIQRGRCRSYIFTF